MKRALILASVASMIEQFNMQNIQLLLDNGFQVDVACNCIDGNTISNERVSDLIRRLDEKGVSITHVPIPRKITAVGSIFASLRIVKKMCDENEYSLIHCHSPIGSVIARLAARKSRKKYNTNVIYTAHGFHFYQGAPLKNWLIYYPIEKFCAKYTDILVTINQEDYSFAQSHMRIKKIEYIPGIGIDSKKFYIEGFNKQEKKESLGLHVNDLMILSVGELNKNKNQEIIIRALANLKDKSRVHYFIAGKGDREKYLSDLASSLNVQLHLLGYRTDIIELLNTADIFALPSIREGLSVALMEAMAAGLPCVVSKIRGNIDLIQENEGGFLCESNKPNDFTNAFEKLLDDAIRGKFGINNRLNINRYDIQNVMKFMTKIYGI